MSRIIIVAGVTCSGKSNLAVRLAQHGGAVINADASQLYSELKILTAFPSDEDMQKVPHKLYGILSPHEKSAAGQWLDKADIAVQEQDLSIICGGTGLYIDAFINGIAQIPPIPTDYREKVLQEFENLGREAFYQKLCQLDHSITLHPNDTQRILRAYEVVTYTGKTQSQWWNEEKQGRPQVEMYALIPDRKLLREKCQQRLQVMVQNGLFDEVSDFIKRYPNYTGPLTNAVGYSAAVAVLHGEISQEEFISAALTETMQYAKRQSTWFRHHKNAKFIYDFGNTVDVATIE